MFWKPAHSFLKEASMVIRDQVRGEVGSLLDKLAFHLKKAREFADDPELVRLHVEIAETSLTEAKVLWRLTLREDGVNSANH